MKREAFIKDGKAVEANGGEVPLFVESAVFAVLWKEWVERGAGTRGWVAGMVRCSFGPTVRTTVRLWPNGACLAPLNDK